MTNIWLKITKILSVLAKRIFLPVHPVWIKSGSWIRDKHPGSATLHFLVDQGMGSKLDIFLKITKRFNSKQTQTSKNVLTGTSRTYLYSREMSYYMLNGKNKYWEESDGTIPIRHCTLKQWFGSAMGLVWLGFQLFPSIWIRIQGANQNISMQICF